MVEMLGTLAIMGVLSVTGIWAYGNAIDSHKANRILNDLNARIHDCSAQMVMMNKDECQLSSFPDKMDDAYATSVQKIDSDFFKVIISDVPQKICQQILNKGIPLASHINLTSCNETNQFELIFHKNLDSSVVRKKCTSDVDCDLCGSCDSDGYCLGECSLPSPDSEENCGENECIVYDEESKACRDACERVEYLTATGTQYIDTGIPFHFSEDTVNLVAELTSLKEYQTLYGVFESFDGTVQFFAVRQLSTQEKWQSVGVQLSFPAYELNKKFKFQLSKVDETYFQYLGETVYTGRVNDNKDTSFTGYIFATNNRGGVAYNAIGKIYAFQHKRNGTLVRDFIPVISPDGEGCMFDKVSQKLFCNAGSGTFKTSKDE